MTPLALPTYTAIDANNRDAVTLCNKLPLPIKNEKKVNKEKRVAFMCD